MSKKKKRPTKRFCKVCQKRTIFNKTKKEILVCSRCGIAGEKEPFLTKPKMQDMEYMEKFK